MSTYELHKIHYDNEKESLVIGYVCDPSDPLPPHALQQDIDLFVQMLGLKNPYINILPFYIFDLNLNQQNAILTFLNKKKDHKLVQTLIRIYNNNRADIQALTLGELNHKFSHEAKETLDELLVDVMIDQVR